MSHDEKGLKKIDLITSKLNEFKSVKTCALTQLINEYE